MDKTAQYIAPCDPGSLVLFFPEFLFFFFLDHDTVPTTNKIFGPNAVNKGDFSNPNMSGFVEVEFERVGVSFFQLQS